MDVSELTCLEICAGAGGQSRGLELAGFGHAVALEIDPDAAETLRLNRHDWNVVQDDVRNLDGAQYHGIDLLAGGVPCPPFSVAGGQLGADDERDLFPEALRLVREAGPAAVMLEKVKGLAERKFSNYRQAVIDELEDLGYQVHWQVLNACEYGVPQLRPRFVLVAIKRRYAAHFTWPTPTGTPPTVGEVLYPFMAVNGWEGARAWARRANPIPPTSPAGGLSDGLKLTVDRCEPGPRTPRGFGQRSGTPLWRVQAISRRRPSSAASRATRSRLRSAHRPDARSSPRLRTALCSASGPTLAHTDIPRRP